MQILLAPKSLTHFTQCDRCSLHFGCWHHWIWLILNVTF